MNKLKLALLGIISILLFISCGKETKKIEKTVTVAYVGSAKTLDPQMTNDKRSIEVIAQLYDSLVELNENSVIVPSIAERWEKIDSLRTRFYIKDNIKFHNGDLLTVNDIKFSLNRLKNSPVVGTVGEPIDRVEIINDKIIDVITKYPYSPILLNLSDYSASIVSEKAVISDEKGFGQKPVGTGAYILENWSNIDKIILKKNKNYFRGEPKIDKLIFKAIPEAGVRVIGLETGEIDVAYTVSPIDVPTVIKNNNLDIISKSPSAIEFIGFNTSKAPFNNKDLRKAVTYALDVDEILKAVLSTYGTNINSPLAPSAFGYTTDRPTYTKNLEKAKEYLKKSGYENGLTVEITYHSNQVSEQIAQIMQAQLKEIGIELKVNPLEWSAFINSTSKGEQQMFHLGRTAPTNDANESLVVFNSKSKGSGGNRFFYDNPSVDKLLDEASKESNTEKRALLYKEAINTIQEDSVMAFSFTRDVIVGVNKRVKGLNIHPSGVNKFKNIYIEEK